MGYPRPMQDPPPPPEHPSLDWLECWGGEALHWIARYHRTIEQRPVRGEARPGGVYDALPAAAPEAPDATEWGAIARDLDEIIAPALTHWQHPAFFGFFPANASPPAMLGELLSAGLGVQGMLWATSPACTELEMRMLDWMASAVGLPREFTFGSETGGGVIQGTASEATLCALVAARRRTLERAGLLGTPRRGRPDLVMYASEQSHSSVMKAAMVAGLADGPDDHSQVRMVATRDDLAMDPAQLGEVIAADIASGRLPVFICATVGTTGTLAFDPLDEVATAADRAGFTGWLHADAAHAGSACVCEEHRWMLRGVERFDSLCFNPHKWLLTNFDCDLFYTRDRRGLTAALSITPEYLRNEASETGSVVDYRDWQIPLGRRFRALKLWLVLRCYGLEGLRCHVRLGVALAERFERWVGEDERFEIAAERRLNLVCFRLRPHPGESVQQANERNRRLLAAINAGGKAYLSHTTVRGAGGEAVVLRLAVGGTHTRLEHVEGAWREIRRLATACETT